MKRFTVTVFILSLLLCTPLFAQEKEKETPGDGGTDQKEEQAVDYLLGGVFGAVSIDGKNYQQLGFRPELKLWKVGIGLDLEILLDEEGKIRDEEWNNWRDAIDKVYYITFGSNKDPFYFRFGGLESTTLGYGTIINGYTNMLEYPTYKRQGLDLGIKTKHFGMQAVVNDFKELMGSNKAIMGGGRLFVIPFSRLQIGASVGGDLNEYKGLRDTDDDGYPDEIDAYPEDDDYVTEIDYYLGHGASPATIADLTSHNLISPITRSMLTNYTEERSRTGFTAVDAGLCLVDSDFLYINIYSQYARSINTGGWGYTAPGIYIKIGGIIEIYGDYRQQSDEFIFSYYNDTYDLERAKYVDDGTGNLYVTTKKDTLKHSISARGYLAGSRINILDVVTGKVEYQDMRWGDTKVPDKSIKGEIALNKDLIPLISKAKVSYVQNNVEDFKWKTESTVLHAVAGIGAAEGVSIDFNYLITYEDKNGDGEIKGDDETITNVNVSTSTQF